MKYLVITRHQACTQCPGVATVVETNYGPRRWRTTTCECGLREMIDIGPAIELESHE